MRARRQRNLLDASRGRLVDVEGRLDASSIKDFTRDVGEWARSMEDRHAEGVWTPILGAVTTDPNIGTGANIAGTWSYNGIHVTCEFLIVFGSAGVGAGNGIYQIRGMPYRMDFSLATVPIGQVHLRDVGLASRYWQVTASSATDAQMVDPNGVFATNAVPWVWAAGDSMRGWMRYKPEVRRAI